VRELEAKGASLKAIEAADRHKLRSRASVLQMLGVFAEFETAIRRERQMEGIGAAKAKGVYRAAQLLLTPPRSPRSRPRV